MKRYLVLAVALAITVWIGRSVVAQQTTNALGIVMIGTYEDLEWYHHLRLGAAPYVDRNAFEEISVLYKFDAAKVSNNADYKTMIPLIKSGMLGLAEVRGGTYVPLGPDATGWEVLVDIVKHQPMTMTEAAVLWGKSHVVISPKSKLWGIPSKGKIVSWRVTEPVTPPVFEVSPPD